MRAILAASAATVALAVSATGCSLSSDAPSPENPEPSGRAAEACRKLHAELPEKLDGQERVETEPATKYTAAWGDPPIELRCGVPKPKKLTPGSEEYNPTSDSAEVNGVGWLPEEQDEGYRFTTTGRVAHVEVAVPDSFEHHVNPLVDLAAAVKKAVPGRHSDDATHPEHDGH